MTSHSLATLTPLLQGNRLWHAQEMLGVSGASAQVYSTGFEALDAVLPGRGWSAGQLNELICTPGAGGEWSLVVQGLLGALAPTPVCRIPQLALINSPYDPYLPAWQAAGIAPQSVLRVDTRAHAQSEPRACWAGEQALHCADIKAVVAWMPRAPAQSLRRLQLAASQSQALLFVIRPQALREHSSPAALRLLLQRVDAMRSEVQLLKCRGSVAQHRMSIDVLSPSLRALLQARKRRAHTVPAISITPQPSPSHRMTPRSQVIGLLPDHLLFGNERAAEGPAMSAKVHHGLDRNSSPLPITLINPAPSPRVVPERALKRAARHARSH
ncbi:MAG: translesion DNA synthesis-associated protein ImuA [Brachymonas sp.]